MSNHAVLPPSAADRWLNCPGSRALCEGLEGTESDAAREGTFAHDIAARALEGDTHAGSFVGQEGDGFTVDIDMAKHLQVYIDYVNDLAWLADYVRYEQNVVFNEDNWGTSDAIIITGSVLDIVDLKFGTFFVGADRNSQLMDYACAALRSLDIPNKITTVRMHIVQPRHYDGDNLCRMSVMSVEDLKRWETTVLEPGILATQNPSARLKPGDHCTFCPGKMKCPAFRNEALATVAKVFPDELDAPAVAPPPPSTLTEAQLLVAYEALPILKAWISAVEEHANAEAKRGHPLPGYKLVASIGNRALKDEKAAVKALHTAGIDPHVERIISPNKAQQALGNKKAHKQFIDDLCSRAVTGSKLVPMSDGRPSLPMADVFDSVD